MNSEGVRRFSFLVSPELLEEFDEAIKNMWF